MLPCRPVSCICAFVTWVVGLHHELLLLEPLCFRSCLLRFLRKLILLQMLLGIFDLSLSFRPLQLSFLVALSTSPAVARGQVAQVALSVPAAG